MKKFAAWLLAMAMCLTMGMGAFAEPAPTPDEAEVGNADEWLFEEDEAEDWDNEEVEDAFFDDLEDDGEELWLDEEDTVEDTLLGAMEVYSWFMLQPLDIDPGKPNQAGTHFQVLDERFNTMDLLRNFVSTYFSDKIVEDLFAMNVYVEENGHLYTGEEGRNIDENIGETEFEVTEESENKIVYTVTVNYWGENAGEEVFTYVRELIDGEWKFTEFPFYW